jgi:hypothetical protein
MSDLVGFSVFEKTRIWRKLTDFQYQIITCPAAMEVTFVIDFSATAFHFAGSTLRLTDVTTL